MREKILSDPQFQAIGPRAYKTARRGDFKTAFDMIYGDLGLNRDEYTALGITLRNIFGAKRGSNKFSALYRLSGTMAQTFGLSRRASDDPRRVALVADLEEISFNYHPRRDGERPPYNALIGYVIAAATLLLASGADAAVVFKDHVILARCAHLLISRDQLSFSITDVGNTIRMLTAHRPITDWILDQDVEALRLRINEKLVRLLRSKKGLAWLQQVLSSPGAASHLLSQFSSPEDRALLRERLRELQTKTPKAPGAAW